MTAQTLSHSHHDWRAGEATRAAALAKIDIRLDAVRDCVRWLVSQGVYVETVDMRIGEAGKPIVRVGASPLLHILFKEENGAGQHWDDKAGRTALDFKAVCLGCEIHWSEVKQ